MTPALPVDSFIGAIRAALERHRSAVLTAAPGAGKTTRVPPALVDAGRVLLLQPRRVAARAMARRIAEERGWTIGREVGWHIRFEKNFSRDTQLLVVTEGILTAYLQGDPLLSDVTTLIIDEFHERSVHADLGLAMAKQAWLARSDLRILVMSATLDSAPVSRFLGDAPVIDVSGALHPLTVEYAPGQSVAEAVERVLPRTTGNVLCFLPGKREIEQAQSACLALAQARDLEVLPLHGSLDAAAQDAALSPSDRRRLILATNIAETSLTVPGVSAVIDSGVQKIARYNADRAVDALVTERITLDSADQRAGRAARLGPGIAIRLWDARDKLRPHREAEIHRVDLSGVVLAIAAWGSSPDQFEWFDRPSDDRVTSARGLLERLGALRNGNITELGRQMQGLPLSPRLSRVLIAGHGSSEAGAACAELSDDRAPQLQQVARRQLGDDYRPHIGDAELRRALLTGYPDRVAKRRSGDRYTLASGHGAILGRENNLQGSDWIIALDVTATAKAAALQTEALIRKAVAIDPEWLEPTHSELKHEFDAGTGSVRATEIDWYDGVRLREHPVAPDPEQRTRLLAEAWLQRPVDEPSAQLLNRLRFAGATIDLAAIVAAAATAAKRLSDVSVREANLPWEIRERLHTLAPATLTVPSGRQMTIEYRDEGPKVAVKLQELFGLAETPRIGPTAVPITLELLAPNGRPVQTTQDLKSFWERTYPEVRKELRGRYPRHPWPDDPWTATPTHRTKKSSSR